MVNMLLLCSFFFTLSNAPYELVVLRGQPCQLLPTQWRTSEYMIMTRDCNITAILSIIHTKQWETEYKLKWVRFSTEGWGTGLKYPIFCIRRGRRSSSSSRGKIIYILPIWDNTLWTAYSKKNNNIIKCNKNNNKMTSREQKDNKSQKLNNAFWIKHNFKK